MLNCWIKAKRYEKYAAAQAWLTDSSITLPTVSNGGAPMLQRTVPYSHAASWVGTKEQEPSTNTLKCPKMLSQQKDFNKAKEEWLKKKQNPIKSSRRSQRSHRKKK